MQNKTLSGIITLLIVGLLIIAGPVDALYLGLSGFKTTPYSFGETINFLGEIEINSNEIVNLQNVSLEVNDEIVCTFDILGNNLTVCEGISVGSILNTASYGYGYGYNSFEKGWNGGNSSSNAGNWTGQSYGYGYGYRGNGELVYNISIKTPQSYLRIPGNNDLKLISNTENQLFNSKTEKIVIQPQNSGGGNGGGGGTGRGEEGGRRGSGLNNNNRNNQLLADFNNALSNENKNSDNGNWITGAVIGEPKKTKTYAVILITLFLITLGLASFAINYRRKNRFRY